MVQTSHIKRYFSDLIQSNKVIRSTAKIAFVLLDLIFFFFNLRFWFLLLSMTAFLQLGVCIFIYISHFSVDGTDPAE